MRSHSLEPLLDTARIYLHVSAGRVTLVGEVASEASRARVERLARHTESVLALRHRLQVYPGQQMRAQDVQLEAAARLALRWAVPNDAASIHTTVEHGRLTLEGEVASEA